MRTTSLHTTAKPAKPANKPAKPAKSAKTAKSATAKLLDDTFDTVKRVSVLDDGLIHLGTTGIPMWVTQDDSRRFDAWLKRNRKVQQELTNCKTSEHVIQVLWPHLSLIREPTGLALPR